MTDQSPPASPSPEAPQTPEPPPPPTPAAAQPQVVVVRQPAPAEPAKKKSWLRRFMLVLFVCIFLLSIVMNGYLILLLGVRLRAGFDKAVIRDGAEDQVVAVYSVSGILDDEAAGWFSRFHDAIARNPNVKAVVLRVNSPGGGVAASDRMSEIVRRLKDKSRMKVVVSMGGVAASGGYYMSAPADEIIAEEATITGSIGVIAQWPVLQKALKHIGVEPMIVRSTHARGWKDDISPFHKPDARQHERLQEVLDKMQERFEQVVRDGRGKRLKTREASYTIDIVKDGRPQTVKHTEHEPFNGKVYLAREAIELGLIDRVGYLPEAIDRAARLADLSDPTVVRYKARRGLVAVLLFGRAPRAEFDVRKVLDDLQAPRIEAIWRPE